MTDKAKKGGQKPAAQPDATELMVAFMDTDPVTTIEYLRKLWDRMYRVRAAVKENEQKAKTQHKKYYDRCTTTRQFDVGDMVLVFLPKKQNKLLAEWLGPYPITEKTSDVTYEVDIWIERSASEPSM